MLDRGVEAFKNLVETEEKLSFPVLFVFEFDFDISFSLFSLKFLWRYNPTVPICFDGPDLCLSYGSYSVAFK